MNEPLTADDIREGLKDAPMTLQYLAVLINAGNFVRAGQVLEEQARYIRQFRAALDANRKIA